MATEVILKYAFFSLVTLSVIIEIAADVLFKKWSLTNNGWLFAIGIVIYLAGTVLWAFSLKYEYFSKAVAVFAILNLIIAVLAGVIIFKDDLSAINKTGIALGIISIILIEL